MSRLGSPLIWRLVAWLILIALIPLATAYYFMQQQVKQTLLESEMNLLSSQVQTFSARLENAPDQAQETAIALAQSTQNINFFLLDSNGRYIAHSDLSKLGTFATDDIGFSLTQLLSAQESSEIVDQDQQIMIASYRKTTTEPIAGAIINIEKIQTPLTNLTNSLLGRIFISLLIMAIAGGIFMLVQMSPSYQLAQFANQLGKKNFLATLNISKFKGEHGVIAKSLMDLSTDIQGIVAELEENVIERTQELETRAVQLKAAADVGKAVTSVRNLAELLQQTTNLINERFKYYHIGIFLLDERREYALLKASNSDGGKRMLERNHKLKVDEKSIVGYAAQNAIARIALDVGQDAVFFDNPDLPSTRSEMALPLIASGQILGVLDVQSTESRAFTEEDIATLQILADQIAIAIQNANLFAETEKALQSSKEVYGEVSREAWRKVLRNQPRIGYIATPPTTIQTYSESLEPSLAKTFETGKVVVNNDSLTVTVPIKIRGQVIGGIRLKKSDIADAWTQDEINLAMTLSDQLSGALESARLYRESQQRAVRETLVSDISARISSVSRVDAILRETVQELGQTLGNATVSFQIIDNSNGHEPSTDLDKSNGKESA